MKNISDEIKELMDFSDFEKMDNDINKLEVFETNEEEEKILFWSSPWLSDGDRHDLARLLGKHGIETKTGLSENKGDHNHKLLGFKRLTFKAKYSIWSSIDGINEFFRQEHISHPVNKEHSAYYEAMRNQNQNRKADY